MAGTTVRERTIAWSLSAAIVLLGSSAGADPNASSITDGKVDRGTDDGYRRYHAVCSHCHGPDGLGGSIAPSLVARPLPVEAFRDITLNGRTNGTSVMLGYANDPNVARHVDAIYAYLQARAEGVIGSVFRP
ncbi:MAG TPA: c-type cytochrome [Azospirillum sp.]|nr:c-type cytochrome [Azospirillum sp.]